MERLRDARSLLSETVPPDVAWCYFGRVRKGEIAQRSERAQREIAQVGAALAVAEGQSQVGRRRA